MRGDAVTARPGGVRDRPAASVARPVAHSKLQFRTDIEGLRGIAVLAVVLFHAAVPGFEGGFVGVDVFFVISGFLITALLVGQATNAGGVGLQRFYAARARRLLPAAATVLVATAMGTAALLPTLRARAALGDAMASALYVANVRFALVDTDYLTVAAPSPYQHYWSLGVEEQFYLLWPVLIIATAWLVRRLGRRSYATTPYVVVLLLVAAVSFGLSLAWTRALPAWAFFSLPTRAWELAIGGLVALSQPAWRRLPAQPAQIAGWGGLGLLLITCTQFGAGTEYPGTAALLPVLGSALLIGAGCATGAAGPARLLSAPPLRAAGRVSYSWYLWHWPVLLLAPMVMGHALGLADRLALVGVSAGLAVLTTRYIENPVRSAPALRASPGCSLGLGGALTAAAMCVTLVLLIVVREPVGRGDAAPPPLPPPAAAVAAHGTPVPIDPYSVLRNAIAASVGMGSVPSNLTPPLATAAETKPAVFVNGCVRSWRELGQPECASGAPESPTTVTLVGDSHAAMWHPAFEPVAEQRHWRLQTMAKVTCPLLDLPITSPYLGREYTECVQWRADVTTRLLEAPPALVVMSMSRRYGADFGFSSYDPRWLDSLTSKVAQLRAAGAHVVVLGPIPDPHSTVPECLSAHLDDASACGQDRAVAVNATGIASEAAATAAGGGEYVDLSDLFCTAQRCPVVVGNTLVFRDDNHVTSEYAQAIGQIVTTLADRAIENR